MQLKQALQTAKDDNIDLVEVAPSATPSVCRLMDYGKYRYEQIKKERLARRTQRSTEIREIRLRPKIGKHDIEAKIRLILRLLGEGSKVKAFVIFRGREHAHPELGLRVLNYIMEALKDQVTVDRAPSMEGGRMNIIVAPLPARQLKTPKMEVKEPINAKT